MEINKNISYNIIICALSYCKYAYYRTKWSRYFELPHRKSNTQRQKHLKLKKNRGTFNFEGLEVPRTFEEPFFIFRQETFPLFLGFGWSLADILGSWVKHCSISNLAIHTRTHFFIFSAHCNALSWVDNANWS